MLRKIELAGGQLGAQDGKRFHASLPFLRIVYFIRLRIFQFEQGEIG